MCCFVKALLYLLPACLALHAAPKALAPEPQSLSKSFFRFGDVLLTLEKYTNGTDRPYVLVSLHSNEAGSIATARSFALAHGTEFFRLQYADRRNVEANLMDRKVVFDPARIFTSWGRRLILKKNNCWDKMVNNRVQQLAHFVTAEVVREKTVVAVHNTEGDGLLDFQKGGKLEKATRSVFRNPALDPHDYILTTDEALYAQLKARQLNVVLQNNARTKDDGSLRVYCVKAKTPYVHIETLAGHRAEQERMLEAVDAILQ